MEEIYNKNSVVNLTKWVRKAIGESMLSDYRKEDAIAAGDRIISEGGWRGDISDGWMNMGYTPADIPDFYP